MSRCHSTHLLSLMAALLFVTPALALNPQPLPPGIAPSFHATSHSSAVRSFVPESRWNNSILRCHAVQVGDPRKQPPMKVCP